MQVITPFRKLILCAENRKEMEDWISALKSVQKWEIHEVTWAARVLICQWVLICEWVPICKWVLLRSQGSLWLPKLPLGAAPMGGWELGVGLG